MKRIGIISNRQSMAQFYGQIFQELLGDYAEICMGAVEGESIRQMPDCDLYVSSVTAYDVLRDARIRDYVNETLQAIRMDVTFSRAAVDLLRTYPEGTKALLINQNKHMSMECIAQLYHLGISNIEFYPCYPGVELLPVNDLAFTVGEPDLVPDGIRHVLDIGSRLPTANVICEVALKLGNAFFLEGKRFKRYRNRLAAFDYSLQTISSNNLTAENSLEIILNSLDKGIVCVNERGFITLINKEARRLLDVSRSEVLGRPAAKVFPYLPFPTSGSGTEGPQLLSVQGTDLGVTSTPLTLEGENLGSFLTLQRFQDSERAQNSLRLQKTREGYMTKAQLKDIIGSSPAISRQKDIARRIAESDAPVLIQGETGVGKTLFAQAIHNASSRAGGAFVTVPCAAFQETELEARLFGTAEDGPASVGRIGLVESADRGTLFLDGIESMSLLLQVSLLRVLKEKAITRIGSDDPIPVDVRIVSSSGGDLQQMVREGVFSRDLYYRLNVIPLVIPPLRRRRQDIPLLIRHLQQKSDAHFELTARARQALLQHRWEGNVRELENCIEYLKLLDGHVIDLDDLPEGIRAFQSVAVRREALEQQSGLSTQEFWVMQELGECYRTRTGMGRRAIREQCLTHGHAVSEHEVRSALTRLAEKGYVAVHPGRGGSCLTEEGYLHVRRMLYGEEALMLL